MLYKALFTGVSECRWHTGLHHPCRFRGHLSPRGWPRLSLSQVHGSAAADGPSISYLFWMTGRTIKCWPSAEDRGARVRLSTPDLHRPSDAPSRAVFFAINESAMTPRAFFPRLNPVGCIYLLFPAAGGVFSSGCCAITHPGLEPHSGFPVGRRFLFKDLLDHIAGADAAMARHLPSSSRPPHPLTEPQQMHLAIA